MDEKQKDRLATIISGLAASGHYTHLKQVSLGKNFDGEEVFEDRPAIKNCLWDESLGLPRYDIIEHALTIFSEIEKNELTEFVLEGDTCRTIG